MKCASCGNDQPAGARYCVHCGAEQSVPTPIAAVAAAAMASRPSNAVPQAANAAHADPAPDHTTRVHRKPAAWTVAAPDAAPSAASASAAPAYASAPRRTGVAVLLVAACVAVAIGAFVAWRTLDGNADSVATTQNGDADESVMSSFPPEATPPSRRAAAPAPPAPGEPAMSASVPAGQANTASAPSVSGSPPAGAEGGKSQAAESPAPVEIKPLPAKPARATRRPPAEKPQPPAPQPPAPVASEPEPRPPVVAAAPKAPPVVDRWARMNDELSRCTREDFIMRVICDQRVRLRYCDGYWGKVSHCPGNPTPDRGQ